MSLPPDRADAQRPGSPKDRGLPAWCWPTQPRGPAPAPATTGDHGWIALRARRLASPGCSLTDAAAQCNGVAHSRPAQAVQLAGPALPSRLPAICRCVGRTPPADLGPAGTPLCDSSSLRCPRRYVDRRIMAPTRRPVDTCKRNHMIADATTESIDFSDGRLFDYGPATLPSGNTTVPSCRIESELRRSR